MKRLILIRHAKSDWSQEGLTDHERGLNMRGKRDVPIMASILIRKYPTPDIILCSDAVRTKETIEGIIKLGFKYKELTYSHNLYLASIERIKMELSTLPSNIKTVMLCGHNPGVSEFLTTMCNAGDIRGFPTLGTALMVLNIDEWTDIFNSTGNRLVRFDYPKKK